MKVFEKLAASYVKNITSQDPSTWPPICMGISFQPERPSAIPEKLEAEKAKKISK